MKVQRDVFNLFLHRFSCIFGIGIGMIFLGLTNTRQQFATSSAAELLLMAWRNFAKIVISAKELSFCNKLTSSKRK